MYKIKLWDEDKWNIHSSSYNSSKYKDIPDDKKEDKKYHEQKYGKEKDDDPDYIKNKEKREKDDKKDIVDEPDEKKGEEIKEEEIPLKAAKQIFSEKKHEAKKAENKKDIKTIEDAIKKAIEEEKKVIIADN